MRKSPSCLPAAMRQQCYRDCGRLCVISIAGVVGNCNLKSLNESLHFSAHDTRLHRHSQEWRSKARLHTIPDPLPTLVPESKKSPKTCAPTIMQRPYEELGSCFYNYDKEPPHNSIARYLFI